MLRLFRHANPALAWTSRSNAGTEILHWLPTLKLPGSCPVWANR